ncbi:hypothetical protein IW140_002697 [Coemansia sp. RSA 1813]|nr:hypothetical protein EV178_000227 [Coemansia sp. RSA 1646]KAJ1769527.1 hypothetical protein LPJ74_003946 [Coemansia sp. RSA 1843]KAJ2090465.1 hypothetical protein IW138_002676 [Coemansia sp. RSA 986]KAJ2215432.1 hypothetical protein EV179_002216 [Coemansia sp. RSA 487]KAJ2570021.1 hypothetical protein IW140_002697 [Coemansia sp. RSA 1813]
MPPARSRLRPAAALLVPLLAAVLFGFVSSPTALHTTTAAALPSAWANKRNPLNSYFAKLAWAWTSALFVAALAACVPVRSPAASARHVARYALATFYWVAMVRWFFGPPLLDRFFVLTGGSCALDSPLPAPIASLSACRAAGGQWAGGHDVSGHCFLLLHSALFLVEEVLVPLLSLPAAMLPRSAAAMRRGAAVCAAALICVWVLMLFFTAKYFHGAMELLSGILVGVGYWAPLYQLGYLSNN